jgi:hypothetical protein
MLDHDDIAADECEPLPSQSIGELVRYAVPGLNLALKWNWNDLDRR